MEIENRLLFIVGPTAAGKTAFAVDIAKKFNGELISADSRQVYRGLDIVTGKDHGDFPIHLIDVVAPDQPFSVSQWHDMAVSVIADIRSRGKLPIVVGGTGLYIKSLLSPLSDISVPPDRVLRTTFTGLSPIEMFNKLKHDFPAVANSLNISDSRNPRRLIRKYEIARYRVNHPLSSSGGEQIRNHTHLTGLTAPKDILDQRIDERVSERITHGAVLEAESVLEKYPHDLPALSACGYLAFLQPDPIASWQSAEHQYSRRQLTWFSKQPGIQWYDISVSGWQVKAYKKIQEWYNKDSL